MDETTRGPDRRTTPRRAEDTALHYARENLLAAALAYAENPDPNFSALWEAAADYRTAEDAAHV